MPTLTLTYTLPDEQGDYDRARLGSVAAHTLWEIDQHCRAILKHGEPTPEVRELCQEIRSMIPTDCLEVV